MALTKTVQSDLYAITQVNANLYTKSSAFSCPTNFSASFYIDWAPVATTATPAATEWRIECSEVDGLDVWTPIYSRLTLNDVPNNPNVTTATAGTNTIIVSNAAGFAVGDTIFLLNGTIANSEWHEITAISGTTFTILDNLQFGQTGATNIFNKAQRLSVELPLDARRRYRFVTNNNRSAANNRNIVIHCAHTTLDAVS